MLNPKRLDSTIIKWFKVYSKKITIKSIAFHLIIVNKSCEKNIPKD